MLSSMRIAAIQWLRQTDARYVPPFAAIVLYLIGQVLGADWRFLGLISWCLLSCYLFYRYGIRFFSKFVLPIEPDSESYQHAYDVLERYVEGHAPYMAVVREGKLLPPPTDPKERSESGQGAIWVDSTSAVVLFTSSGPTRIKGPGLHFTRDGESIGIVIDLRPQTRSATIEAQTRDGIWVTTKITVKFQVDGVKPRKAQQIDQKQEPLPAPYAWSQAQLRRVLGFETIEKIDQKNRKEKEPRQEEKRGWDQFILSEAVKQARTLIARHTFDRLTEPHDASRDPHADIQIELKDALKRALENHARARSSGLGINLSGVSLTHFEPRDDAINLQRFESWQAEWLRRMTITRAIGKTRSRRSIELARAQAQMDTVARIIQALEASQQAGANNADLIALRFLETVESLANDTLTRWNLSEGSQQTLDQIRRRLLKENHHQDSNSAAKSG